MTFHPGESIWTYDGFPVTVVSGPYPHDVNLDGYMVAFEDGYMDFVWLEELQQDEPTDAEVNKMLGLGMMEEPL